MTWETHGTPPRDGDADAAAAGRADAQAVTRLLDGARAGDPDASRQLLDAVYSHLRAIAAVRMAGERSGHTLQPTALVNEAYARLFADGPREYKDRGHFFAAAALAMERILVDHARRRAAGSARGGESPPARSAAPRHGPRNPQPMPASVVELSERDDPEEILTVHETLERFAGVDPRAAQVVRLRFFGGLSVEETALAMDCSVRTVEREWEYARAWLGDRIRALQAENVGPDSRGANEP
jgi:RNA polymerase sigma factor (TIGR02999 family)